MLAAVMVFYRTILLFQLIHDNYPEHQIAYLISQYLHQLITTVLAIIPLVIFLVAFLEVVVGLVPSRILGNQWRKSSWIQICVQSLAFGTLLVSFDYYLNYYPISVIVVMTVHLLTEVVVRRGTRDSLDEVNLQPIKCQESRVDPLDHVLLWLLSSLILSIILSLLVAFTFFLFPTYIERSFYLKLGILLVSGIGITELIIVKRGMQTTQLLVLSSLIPTATLIMLGPDWSVLPYLTTNIGAWSFAGLALFSLYPSVRISLGNMIPEISQKLISSKTRIDLSNDQVFLNRMTLLFGIHLTFVVLYWLSGAQFRVTPQWDLPVQVLWNGFDPCIIFKTGGDYYGVSTLGFLFPLVLMSYILILKTREWSLDFGSDVLLAFLGTLVISLLFLEIRPTGVAMTLLGDALCVALALGIGFGSNWERNEAKAIQLLSVIWFAMIPGDFLYGLGILGRRFLSELVCIGAYGWGIGDGLWLTAFCMMFFMFLASKAKQKEAEEDSDEASMGEPLVSESIKKRMISGFLAALMIPVAWALQLIITIFGLVWFIFNESLYPLGIIQDFSPSLPTVGALGENMLLVLISYFILETLDILTAHRFTVNTTLMQGFKILCITSLSVLHLTISGGGLVGFYLVTLALVTAALVAFAYSPRRPQLPQIRGNGSTEVELDRFLSPQVTVATSLFLLVFYLRSFPFIIATRFSRALFISLMALFISLMLVSIGFVLARILARPFSSHMTERMKGFLCLIFIVLFLSEITWALLPIPLLVPIFIILVWMVHKKLKSRWPRRFGREAIRVRSGEEYRAIVPNVKALLLCVIVILGPTLATNETQYMNVSGDVLSDTRIAIIDDGINTQAAILRDHVVAERSFVEPRLGYDEYEPDPLPQTLFTSHATGIALAILDVFPQASLISARVRSSDDAFTDDGFKEAVRWSVNEAHASIISLSFGSDRYDLEDGRDDEILRWAWERGVFIVASAGNDNLASWAQGGLGTLGYPGANINVMTVGASNSSGLVHPQSSRGPVHNGNMKPEVLAPGYLWDNDLLWGTSLAAPRAAAGAAIVIETLNDAGIPWTPGLVRAALISTATNTAAPSYAQGTGLMNEDDALEAVLNAPRNQDGLPLIITTLPTRLPLEFEMLFAGTNQTERVSVFCSTLMNVSLIIPASLQGVVTGHETRVNQCGIVELYLTPPDSDGESFYEGDVILEGEGVSTSIRISFNALVPRTRLAIDTSHDRRNWYTTFMLYAAYYDLLTQRGIAVTEIRNPDEFCESRLEPYDALLIIDPYSGWFGRQRNFSEADRATVQSFVSDGGNLLLALGDSSNATTTNLLLNWTGITVHSGATRSSHINTTDHPIMEGISYPEESHLEDRPSFSTFNTTMNYTWVMYHPGFFFFPSEAILACSEFPTRIAAFGKSEWFQNDWFIDPDCSEAALVFNLTYWILGLI